MTPEQRVEDIKNRPDTHAYLNGLAIEQGITAEQLIHLTDNKEDFQKLYFKKYIAGQKEHGGNMWDMGAYQALENMEDEVLDMWSYCRQVRKCLDEIRSLQRYDDYNTDYANGMQPDDDGAYVKLEHLKEILNRVKED